MPVPHCLQCHQHLWCVYRLRQILFNLHQSTQRERERRRAHERRGYLLSNLPQRERRAHAHTQIGLKGKDEVQKKKRRKGKRKSARSLSLGLCVYLQRDRARQHLKRKDAQYCFKHITHIHTAIRNKAKNNIPPDKHPLMTISIKIEFISMHWTWHRISLLLN